IRWALLMWSAMSRMPSLCMRLARNRSSWRSRQVADLISAVDIEWPYMLAKSARQMQCDACGQWIQPGGQLFHTDLSAGVTFCRWCAYREVRVNRPDLIRAVWWHESLLSDKAQSVIEASGGSRR